MANKTKVFVSHAMVNLRITAVRNGVSHEFGVLTLDLVNDPDPTVKAKHEDLLKELGKLAHQRMATNIAPWEKEVDETGPQPVEPQNAVEVPITKTAAEIVEDMEREQRKLRLEAERQAKEEAARLAREQAAEVNTEETEEKPKRK